MRDFRREDFARFHPGGSLGQQLSKVDHHLRPLAECRVADESSSVRAVLVKHGRGGRRSGAIMLLSAGGQLSGIFTDSDLARLFESRRDAAIDRPIREVMTQNPHTVPAGSMLVDAVTIMAERKISELPVVDADGKPLGLLDVTDVLGALPAVDAAAVETTSPSPAARPGGPPRPKAPFFPRP
jgi:arabinose-5-phosphate isomerase